MLVNSVICSCILVTTLGALPSASAQVVTHVIGETDPSAEQAGHRFDGTWWLSSHPPAQRPFILTMTLSGAFILVDSIDGGGHVFTGNSFSLVQGSWTRSGRQSAQALGLRFVYAADGKTEAVERVRLSLWFEKSDHRIHGEYQLEEMFCTEQNTPFPFTVPVCPDPTIAPTEVLRGPAAFTGVRVPIDSPLE
jgi:hypothetical protein